MILATSEKSYFKQDNSSQDVILLSHKQGFNGQLSCAFKGTTILFWGTNFLSSVEPKNG